MPFVKLQTNKQLNDEQGIAAELSKLVASELGKPEDYVMVAIDRGVTMSMGGSPEPAVFMELKSIGLPETKAGQLSKVICQFVEEKLDINGNRVYINFSDVNGKMWGWDGRTF